MKLIHCADLHLDSPLETNLPPPRVRERRGELLSAFSGLVELADSGGVSAILIAGDLFDGTRTTRRTEQYVLNLITEHPNVFFFYLAGNHDSGHHLAEGGSRPENLLTFGSDWSTYDFGEVLISGSERPDPDRLSLPADRLNIVLLHGQSREGGAARENVIPFGKYKNRNIDYLALGHLHAYREAALDERGVACYSGCLEGRGFDECGPKGYVLLEIENGKILHQFVPFAKRQLHEIGCDVTGCASQLELEKRVDKAVRELPACDLVRVVLTGSRPAELLADLPRVERMLSDRFYFAKLADSTRLLIRPEDYSHSVSLKGEFVRRVMASELPEQKKEQIIACGFRALSGEELDL